MIPTLPLLPQTLPRPPQPLLDSQPPRIITAHIHKHINTHSELHLTFPVCVPFWPTVLCDQSGPHLWGDSSTQEFYLVSF